MAHRFRSDSTLCKLSEIQLEMLFDWILETSLDQARERAASAAPYGFNLQIHKTTLARFFREEKKRRHAEELAQIAACATTSDSVLSPLSRECGDESSVLVANLIEQSRAEFAHAIYELSLAVSDPKNFDRLSRALHNIDMATVKKDQISIQEKSHALAQERLAFEKLKFEFDASRELLKCAVQYTAVIKDESVDDQDKIWKARQICFGPLPENVLSGAFYAHAQSRSSTPSQKSDTLGHVPPFAEANTVTGHPSGGGLGKPNTHSPAQESPLTPLLPVESVSATTPAALEVIPRPNTLKHTTEVLCPSETQDLPSVHPSQGAEGALTPRSMPYSDWINAASNKEVMRQFIFKGPAGGLQQNFDRISQQNKMVWIQRPDILQLTVPTAR